jgi:antitoxin HicB
MEEAIDCLGGMIAHAIAEREPIPGPAPEQRGRHVPVPVWIAGKYALYRATRERGLSNMDVARRLGVTETVVRRMLDPDHTTSPEKIQTALAFLGKRLVAGLEDAA